MKALKLKSSTKENPIWGFVSYCGDEDFFEEDEVITCGVPDLFVDEASIKDISSHCRNIKNIENFELVTVKITIE